MTKATRRTAVMSSNRVSLHSDEIRLHALADRTDLGRHAERFGGDRHPTDHRLHGCIAAVLHAINELFGVAAVRAGHSIGTQNNLESRLLEEAAGGQAGVR